MTPTAMSFPKKRFGNRISKKLIYLDHHATTPLDARVLKAMMPYLTSQFGNAASDHVFGRQARKAVEQARSQVASLVGAEPREVVFTSGATESDNLAIKGVAAATVGAGLVPAQGKNFITTAIEHKAVLDSCKRLEMTGFHITVLPVGRDGILKIEDLKQAIRPETLLISVMLANNEIGTIQPVAEIGALAHERGILFHCDAAQALGKIPIDVRALNIDLLSVTAHKIHGPKGVGALIVRKSGPQIRLLPLIDGGGHETGLRSGTLNVAGIVGFGKACEISRMGMRRESKRLTLLRDRLQKGLFRIGGVRINGGQPRLPNNLNISFEGILSEALTKELKGIAVSSGSACLSASAEPSYVLKAIGVPENLRRSSIRFGLGRFNTKTEIDEVVSRVKKAVSNLRARP